MPQYYQDRQYQRRSPIGYAPQVGGIGYISHSDPTMTDRLGQVLQNRQERFDTFSHALSQAEAELSSIPMPEASRDVISDYLESSVGNIEDMVSDDYEGDYGLAGRDIMRRLGKMRGELSQVGHAFEEEQRYRQIFDQFDKEGVLADKFGGYDDEGNIVSDRVDPFSVSEFEIVDGQLKRTNPRDYSDIRKRSEYLKWGQDHIFNKLNKDTTSRLFQRLSAGAAKEAGVDPRAFFVDETLQGYAVDELRKMIDEGELLDDATIERFFQDTTFGFEFGMDKDNAKDYLANMMYNQVSHGIGQSARQDPVFMAQLGKEEPTDPSGSYMYSEAAQTESLKTLGIKDNKQLSQAIRDAERSGDTATAKKLRMYKEETVTNILADHPQFGEVLENKPENQFIGLFSGLDVSHLGGEEQVENMIEAAVFDVMDNNPRSLNRFSDVRNKWREFRSGTASYLWNQIPLEEDVKESLEYRAMGKVLRSMITAEPELQELFYTESHPAPDVTREGRNSVMGEKLGQVLQAGIDRTPIGTAISSVSNPKKIPTPLAFEVVEKLFDYADYYNGQGEYESTTSYRDFSKVLNNDIKNAELDSDYRAYGMDSSLSYSDRKNHINKVSGIIDLAFKDPDILNKHEMVDPDDFNINNIHDMFIKVATNDNLPKVVFHSTDDDGNRQVYRGTLNLENFGLRNFSQVISTFGNSNALFERALGAAVPATITGEGLNFKEVYDSIYGTGSFNSAYGEDAENDLNWKVFNEGNSSSPVYKLVDSDGDELKDANGNVVKTDNKFHILNNLWGLQTEDDLMSTLMHRYGR